MFGSEQVGILVEGFCIGVSQFDGGEGRWESRFFGQTFQGFGDLEDMAGLYGLRQRFAAADRLDGLFERWEFIDVEVVVFLNDRVFGSGDELGEGFFDEFVFIGPVVEFSVDELHDLG